MNKEEFFPIKLRCYDTGHGWVQNPEGLKGLFLKHKPREVTWYGFDADVLSPTRILFKVREMYDSFFGGIGDVILEFVVDCEAKDTLAAIEQEAWEQAQAKRSRELMEQEQRIIQRYADDIVTQVTQ